MIQTFRVVGRDLDEDRPAGPGEWDQVLRRVQHQRVEHIERMDRRIEGDVEGTVERDDEGGTRVSSDSSATPDSTKRVRCRNCPRRVMTLRSRIGPESSRPVVISSPENDSLGLAASSG